VGGRQAALGLPLDIEDDLTLERLRSGRVAVACLELGRLELVHAPDGNRADVDDLDLGLEAMAVLGLVRRVEPGLELLDPRVVDRTGWHVEAPLGALACVAAVSEPLDEAPLLGDTVLLELGGGLGDELVVAGLQARLVDGLERMALGCDELVLEIGSEEAGG